MHNSGVHARSTRHMRAVLARRRSTSRLNSASLSWASTRHPVRSTRTMSNDAHKTGEVVKFRPRNVETGIGATLTGQRRDPKKKRSKPSAMPARITSAQSARMPAQRVAAEVAASSATIRTPEKKSLKPCETPGEVHGRQRQSISFIELLNKPRRARATGLRVHVTQENAGHGLQAVLSFYAS